MVKKKMYQKIQKLRKQGKSKTEISSEMKIDPATIRKYFYMEPDEYNKYQGYLQSRKKLFEDYLEEILEIYKINNAKRLNMAAVYDYLEERYEDLPGNEQTLRNYIQHLISSGSLTLSNGQRCYEQVPELPYGKQLQIDFGEYKTPSKIKFYIFAGVLSASRFKYISLQTTPFTTLDVIFHLLDCFDYLGGLVEELVIDQDSVLVTSENHGDIIYTNKFNQFIKEMGLRMYVCRKADPESKGKIENVIKYVKYNFFQVRDFGCLAEARESLSRWLKRRGNGKLSQATKRIPLDEIEEERKHLLPLRNSIFRKNTLLDRKQRLVSDKGFIMVDTNEYSIPMQYRNRQVEIFKAANELFIYDEKTGKEITFHPLSVLSGQKIVNRDHFRLKTQNIKALHQNTREMYAFENWKLFVDLNIKSFQRFSRDQCLLAKKQFTDIEDESILEIAVDYCLENNTLSMTNLRDTYLHKLHEHKEDQHTIHSLFSGAFSKNIPPGPQVAKRDINEYELLVSSPKEGVQ